jgi:hypothetical protein
MKPVLMFKLTKRDDGKKILLVSVYGKDKSEVRTQMQAKKLAKFLQTKVVETLVKWAQYLPKRK